MLAVAEMNRIAGDEHRARQLVAFAVEAFPGHGGLTDFESGKREAPLPPGDGIAILLPKPDPPPSSDLAGPHR
jgi:hypothetical protein